MSELRLQQLQEGEFELNKVGLLDYQLLTNGNPPRLAHEQESYKSRTRHC